MPYRSTNPDTAAKRLSRSITEVCRLDTDLAAAMSEVGRPPIMIRGHGFPTLLRAIVAQQVSAAAARAIWGRVEAAVQPLTAETFLTFDEDAIRALGFSRPKIRYAFGLAEAVVTGSFSFEELVRMPDEDAIAALTEIKGIGRWSAEVYLLFALGRPDVWPALDLALVVAQQKIKGLDERPKPGHSTDIAEAWRPWRSGAAILLWHYYRTTP